MFTQYRSSVLLLSSLLLSTMVSGCFSSGSDNHEVKYSSKDDGSPGLQPSLASVKVNFFNSENAYQYLVRNQVTIRTGSQSESSHVLYGQKPKDDVANDDIKQYYLGDGFTSSFPKDKLPAKWLKTDGVRKVSINWQDNSYETPHANKQILEYIPIELSGNAGVNANAPVGIYTVLNALPNTQTQNFVYPENSRCYVVNKTTEKAYFDFDDTDATTYQTLEQWKKAQDVQTGYYQYVPAKVGTSNDIDAVYLVRPEQMQAYQSDKDHSHAYDAAVNYNNKVYKATYYSKGDDKPNTDPKSSLVECETYNNVAADFISNKVKQYYR